MSASSPIGRFRSSAFRLSNADVSVSLAGSCLSPESAPGPSIMGFENEAERSLGRPCRQADGRSKRAWQSHGDDGVKLARSYAPSLAWLLPVPKTETPASNQVSAAAIATEVKQQLEPIARGFDVVQRSIQQLASSIEQLATKIDELAANQVTQNSATLQAVEQDNSQTPSSPPPGVSTTANAGQQVSDNCDIEACKQAYFTFNPADCTYQPNNARAVCARNEFRF